MTYELFAHLMESTLFAVTAALLNLLLRKNGASVRHRIWFLASIKFLIPFSLLIGIGRLVPKRAIAPAIEPAWIAAAREITHPLTTLSEVTTSAAVATDKTNYIAVVAFVLWAAGFAGIAGCWLTRWKRIHKLRRSASALVIGDRQLAIPVVSSQGIVEPGIVGIVHPVLLLPEGIENHLDPGQLDAILAHEFAHVRRRDNLTAAIHMAVQSLFWFHPIIWWLGMRLVEERERACDEEVLRLGIRPQVYATGILNVCRLYIESPLACVSGVTGSDLKKRIDVIMKNTAAIRMDLVRKASLIAFGITAIALPVTLGIFSATATRAQAPAFEAASVKPTDLSARTGMDFRITGERLVSTRWNLQSLITQAYGVRHGQILGGPAWVRDDQFDIEATAGKAASRDQMLAMLRTLLEDRFKLKVRRETREGSVYALTVEKSGHKLKPPANEVARSMIITHRNTPGVSYTDEGRNATVPQLVQKLSDIVRGPVSDQTGITGNFDFKYDYVTPDASVDAGPSVFAAVRDQLGLKLEVRKGQVEILVIEHVEKPSAN